MSLVNLGNGFCVPEPPRVASVFGGSNTTAMTDSTHKVALCGKVWNRDGTTKTLVGVGILFGAITKASLSGLTITQEGVSTSAGPPGQPDGTAAQSWTVANGNAAFASTTWLNTSDNAGVSVAYGQTIAITVAYDGSGRLGSDSVTLRGATAPDAGAHQTSGLVYFNGTAWTAQAAIPDIVLKFSDGSYGTLMGTLPATTFGSLAYNSGSAADECGLEFTPTAPVEVDGMWCLLLAAANADCSVVLYEGTTALATTALDSNQLTSTSPRFAYVPLAPQALAAGTTYRLAVKPTTANNVTLYYVDLSTATHRQAAPGFGEAGAWVSRVDAGAWSAPLTTRVPLMGLRVSQIDNGTGGAGGGTVGYSRGRVVGGA